MFFSIENREFRWDDEPFLIYGQKSILYMIKVIKVIMHAISSGHAICIYVAKFRNVEEWRYRSIILHSSDDSNNLQIVPPFKFF